MGTLITVLLLVIIVGLIIWKLIRDKKAGKTRGCDCSGCNACKGSDQHIDQDQDQSDSRE